LKVFSGAILNLEFGVLSTFNVLENSPGVVEDDIFQKFGVCADDFIELLACS
jgi:hypothetical protein